MHKISPSANFPAYFCLHVLVIQSERNFSRVLTFFLPLIVCKLLTVELQDALEKTARSKEVLELGEVLDTGKRKRKIQYNTS